MKEIVLIGARGMGRTIHNYLEEFEEFNTEFIIKGFLDDKKDALDDFENYAPIIGTVDDYTIGKDDWFICTLGDITYKHIYSQPIIDKGGRFYTLIHPLARVMKDAKIGEGTVVGPWASIGSGVIVGKHCLVQTASLIGHDVHIGDWSRIDTHVVCTGGAEIGSNVTIHTGSIINEHVVLEDDTKVGAGSFVIKKVKQGQTVYGNPAKVMINS